MLKCFKNERQNVNPFLDYQSKDDALDGALIGVIYVSFWDPIKIFSNDLLHVAECATVESRNRLIDRVTFILFSSGSLLIRSQIFRYTLRKLHL